ncbi:hypothetical protein ACIQC5_20465 [Paenarthrobacter sp. NPDC092416]|uniref:hypothetical protein n=1 Tax=Paenarthrobacter sp. NPDC092416 TaxID=3364386 RepID=UPI003825A852
MTTANRDLFQALKAHANLAKAFGPPPAVAADTHAFKPGDSVEAWHNGRLYHRGTVLKVVAGTDVFWIQDAETGSRRLLDMEALEIVPAEEPIKPVSAASSSTLPATLPATLPEPQHATVTPISPYPLFHDGTQAIA